MVYFLFTAMNRHTSKQEPQWIQALWSISWTFFFFPAMQLTGQTRTHAWQPVHFLGRMEN